MKYEISLVLYLTELIFLMKLAFLNIFVQYLPDFNMI